MHIGGLLDVGQKFVHAMLQILLIGEIINCTANVVTIQISGVLLAFLLLCSTVLMINWSHLLLYCCIVREHSSCFNSIYLRPICLSPPSHLLAALRNATCWDGIGWDSKSFPPDKLTTLHVVRLFLFPGSILALQIWCLLTFSFQIKNTRGDIKFKRKQNV